jgi:hypothetical protein
MDGAFNTLHDFMIHTENVTYLLIGASLVGIVAFWRFLSGRDQD